jgi:diguanylate cyclase (GGDEF)-like protein
MKIHMAEQDVLEKLLNRHKRHKRGGHTVDLSVVLREVLNWANRLIPSESGSILLDDPILKMQSKRKGRLCFTACFGKKSASIVGTSFDDCLGIAGESYRKGNPYISKNVRKDRRFYSKIDEKIDFATRSIICSPIAIDGAVIGVIELINKKDSREFRRKDLMLLKIFAGYTATLIKNALNARDIEEDARRDNLTGLYNDRFLFRSLECAIEELLRKGGDVTLIFLDLDRFKEVNDLYGHLAGSAVLKEVADVLRKIFRGTKAVLARYGGDEYVIVLPGRGLEDSIDYAERIRKGIASRTFLPKGISGDTRARNISGVVTCSVGVASLSGNMVTGGNVRRVAEDLIRSADSAMYTAKNSGKNRVAT